MRIDKERIRKIPKYAIWKSRKQKKRRRKTRPGVVAAAAKDKVLDTDLSLPFLFCLLTEGSS
jgi:hypothetical protein